MIGQNRLIITKAMFFETRTPKHKPIVVEGRDFYSLTYRYSGRASISVGGEQLVSAADSITFMPKGISYTAEVQEEVHMATVHFDFESELTPLMPMVINAEGTALRSLFGALMKSGSDISSDLTKMSIFYEILAELSRANESEAKKMIPTKIALSKEIMENEFSDPYFSVSALSDRIGVSSAYLRREFRNAYSISPVGYLKELRIEKAKFLLLTEQHTVAEVATECGYTGASYFIQDFHRATGESPRVYRERKLDVP